MLPEPKLDALLARHRMIESELASQVTPETYVKLSREFAELDPVIAAIKAYREVADEIAGLDALLHDAETDAEMRAIAADEKPELEQREPRSRRRSGWRCCRRTRWTSAMSSSKSAPAPAATRPRCSPATCSACTSAMPPSRAGRSR